MKARLFLFITGQLLASLVHAGEIRPFEAMLRSASRPNGKTAIEFCELGVCEPIGRAQGYTKKTWKEIRTICRNQATYGEGTGILAQALAFAVGSYGGGPVLGMVSASAITALVTDSVEAQSALVAGDTLPGVLGEGQFELTVRDFVSLMDGIQACSDEWQHSHDFMKASLLNAGVPFPKDFED